MKFSDLNPRMAEHNVLTMDCPCGQGHRIAVPLDDPRWKASGSFPDSFSVTPSIDAGCWHGNITNGEISHPGPARRANAEQPTALQTSGEER